MNKRQAMTTSRISRATGLSARASQQADPLAVMASKAGGIAKPAETTLESAIRACLAKGCKILAPFLTAGFPDRAAFVALLRMVEDTGCDVVEVGLPFSDPLADGPAVQFASHAALLAGSTIARALEDIRAAAITIPVVLMSYLNPILAYGPRKLVSDARAAGVRGIIVPDAPFDRPNRSAIDLAPLSESWDRVLLTAPTLSDARLRAIGRATRGFLYAVTVTGVTGVRDGLPDAALTFLARTRAATAHPVLAGFGIGDAATARRIAKHCDGVIVGSAIIEELRRSPRRAAVRNAARLIESLRKVL